MQYPITQIKCGDDIAGMWVGIRYRSEDGESHDFYIVGGEEAGVQPVDRTLLPMYFERDDQSLSCYEAADRIAVTERSIVLTLNKNGRASLELSKIVEFVSKKPGRDFKKAKMMFLEMRKRHTGEVIHIVDQRAQQTGTGSSDHEIKRTSAAGSRR